MRQKNHHKFQVSQRYIVRTCLLKHEKEIDGSLPYTQKFKVLSKMYKTLALMPNTEKKTHIASINKNRTLYNRAFRDKK